MVVTYTKISVHMMLMQTESINVLMNFIAKAVGQTY